MKTVTLASILAVVIILVLSASPARGQCCPGVGAVCKDGYKSGVFECCGAAGKKGCNIFCCNCDGGCRPPTDEGCKAYCAYGLGVCNSGCDLCIGKGCHAEACQRACRRDFEGCEWRCRSSTDALPSNAAMEFAALDGDKDGLLTLAEVERGRGKVKLCVGPEENLAERFSQMDANKDGKVGRNEAGITEKLP
ncbi:MAG: hypothetical protein ACJ75H_24785 [Thermoanaerobaculia bacterium]